MSQKRSACCSPVHLRAVSKPLQWGSDSSHSPVLLAASIICSRAVPLGLWASLCKHGWSGRRLFSFIAPVGSSLRAFACCSSFWFLSMQPIERVVRFEL